MEGMKSAASGVVGDLARARIALDERGQKLGELEERTAAMMASADSFSKHAHDVYTYLYFSTLAFIWFISQMFLLFSSPDDDKIQRQEMVSALMAFEKDWTLKSCKSPVSLKICRSPPPFFFPFPFIGSTTNNCSTNECFSSQRHIINWRREAASTPAEMEEYTPLWIVFSITLGDHRAEGTFISINHELYISPLYLYLYTLLLCYERHLC